MSYLVLARKWRPQSFEDVTGQEHVVRTLANAIAADRVAHAFLLCGPRGVGKTTTARLLAKALNCAKGPTAEPCGECLPCKEIAQGSSVDVAEIDGASNNGVDNVRELREAARYMPQRDRHKVYIIDEVHMLSVAAFNALLKTLEEPPPHVKFIFATTDPQKLPDTILSRCQRHNFRRVPLSKMVQRLRRICDDEQVKVSDRALGLLCTQADGGMRDALSLLDQLLSQVGTELPDAAVEEALGLVDRGAVLAIARSLLLRDGKAVLAQVGELHDRGVELKKLCEELAQLLRDLLVARTTGEAPPDRSDAERQALQDLAKSADPAQLTRLFDLVHGAIKDVAYAASPRLALEVALLTGVSLAPSQGLADLAARLESVAASLGGPRSSAPVSVSVPASASVSAPPPKKDLVSQVQQMVRAKPGARESSSRTVTPPPDSVDDDEPAAPVPDAPARVLPREESPGGCATAECLPGAEPLTIKPAADAGDDPTKDPGERWASAVEALRKQDPMLAVLLAEARLLWLRPGEVALGFTPDQKFPRSQVEGGKRKDVERVLSAWFGRATTVKTQDAAADAPVSIAEQKRRDREARAKTLRQEARESAAVRAVQTVLGGEIEDIEIIDG